MKQFRNILILILVGFCGTAYAQRYAPEDTTYIYDLNGTVYANMFEGRRTASGEVFRHKYYTAAHWKIKLGTLVMVSCPETGKQIIVKVNDRCPKKGLLDLTKQAARDLGVSGTKKLKVRQLSSDYMEQWKNQTGPMEYHEAAEPTEETPVKKKNPSAKSGQRKVVMPPDDEDEPQY